jgi:hypothetical protein
MLRGSAFVGCGEAQSRAILMEAKNDKLVMEKERLSKPLLGVVSCSYGPQQLQMEL